MMTKTGMWLTYIASCRSVFILQIISKFWYGYTTLDSAVFPKIQDRFLACWAQDKWLYLILLGLIVFSIIWDIRWKRNRHNTRIKFSPEEDSTLEAALTIVAYLAIAYTINLDAYGIIVSLVILIVLGFAIVQTGNIQVCLYFLLHGYHIYTCGKNKILTKKSREQYLLLLDDSSDGIEAQELTQKVYIVYENR